VESEQIAFLRGDDTHGVIEVSAAPIRDDDGRITAGVVIFSDITERTRSEMQAREHQAQLAHVARLSTLGEMATGIAHEINQPLTAMVTYTQASLRMMDASHCDLKKLRGALREVAAQGLRAAEIIRRIREFTRVKDTKRSTADLNNLARAAVRFVEAEARQNGVTIALVLASELPEVVADTIQIEQVILNLLRNAMEAMADIPAGQRLLTLQTRERNKAEVELTVSDTGPGLSDDTNGRMFDAFFTTKPQGMGMGLSLSRSIVEAHKGRLWADAERGEGAMFHLSLPRAGRWNCVAH